MARDYRVVIDFEALDSLPRSGKRREVVISYLRELSQFAHLGGDFQLSDPETHRSFEVSIVAGYAVTWWIDASVHNAKVIDIRSAN
ncbi:hypothetical protein N9891_01610 [bacterium]|nr:hypothetical protein [bacterium]